MIKTLTTVLGILLFSITGLMAQQGPREDRFTYYGEQQEIYRNLDEDVYATVYREVQVPDICTRQVPYPERICRTVTNYRRECYQEPYPRQVCTMETRYRQECRTVTRQVCENRPVCTVVNGRRVCHPQQVCRQVPQQECRQIPVQERVCRTINEYRQICRDVPYPEQICHTETRYRNETYSCTRTERRAVQELVARYRASMKFDIRKDPALPGIQTEFISQLFGGNLDLRAQNMPGMDSAFYLAQKEIRRSQQGIDTLLDAVYRVSVYDRDRFMAPFTRDVNIFSIARGGKLEASVGTVSYAHLVGFNLRLSDPNTGAVIFDRALAPNQYEVLASPGGFSRVVVDLNLIDNRPIPAGMSYQVQLTVEARLGDRELLQRDTRTDLRRQGQSSVFVE